MKLAADCAFPLQMSQLEGSGGAAVKPTASRLASAAASFRLFFPSCSYYCFLHKSEERETKRNNNKKKRKRKLDCCSSCVKLSAVHPENFRPGPPPMLPFRCSRSLYTCADDVVTDRHSKKTWGRRREHNITKNFFVICIFASSVGPQFRY